VDSKEDWAVLRSITDLFRTRSDVSSHSEKSTRSRRIAELGLGATGCV